MTRSTLGPCALLVGLFAGAWAFAQDPAGIEAARMALHRDRQATIAAHLTLTDDEGLGFWPVYRQYRMEMARVGDRIVKLLTEFSAKYATLSDADATRLLDEFLSIQSSELAIRKKYLKDFRKVIPPKKVGRFYQIENRLDAALRHELGGLIPLAE